MARFSVAAAVVGAIIILVGLAGLFGVIPTLQSTGPPGGGGGNSCAIAPFFVATATNLTVSAHDESAIVENGKSVQDPSGMLIGLSWGDGTATKPVAEGSTTTHGYANAGTYTISESIQVSNTPCLTTDSASFQQSITVNQTAPAHGTPPYRLTPAFAVTTRGIGAAITDESIVQNVTALNLTMSWGDGTSTYLSGVGATATHTYAVPACSSSTGTCTRSYGISEIATGNGPSGQAIHVSTTTSISLNYTGSIVTNCTANPTGPGCQPSPPPTPQPSGIALMANAATLGLIGAGAAIAFLPNVEGRPGTRFLIGIVAVAILAVAGFFIGGLGLVL
jgi:hypothetical protein